MFFIFVCVISQASPPQLITGWICKSIWVPAAVFPSICEQDYHNSVNCISTNLQIIFPKWTTITSDADNTTTYRRLNLQGYLSAAKVHARQFPPQFSPAPSSAPYELISTDFWIWFPSVCESYFQQFAFQIFDPICTRMSWGRELWDRWDFASFVTNNPLNANSRMNIL